MTEPLGDDLGAHTAQGGTGAAGERERRDEDGGEKALGARIRCSISRLGE